jgi:hypothetical protein
MLLVAPQTSEHDVEHVVETLRGFVAALESR